MFGVCTLLSNAVVYGAFRLKQHMGPAGNGGAPNDLE